MPFLKWGEVLNYEVFSVFGIIGTLAGLLIGYFAFRRDKDKDLRNDASRSAVIETQLSNIDQGVRSIQIDLKANERRVADLSEKVGRLDENIKSAHKRIDHFENKGEM